MSNQNRTRDVRAKRVSAPVVPSYNIIKGYKQKKEEIIEEGSSDEDNSADSGSESGSVSEEDSSEEARRMEKKQKNVKLLPWQMII